MKAYVITIAGDAQSEAGADVLRESSAAVGNEFDIETFDAITPETVERDMARLGIKWSYPWDQEVTRPELNLRLHPYTTVDPLSRVACFMSHYFLWDAVTALRGPILIMEDDAEFVAKMDPAVVLSTPHIIIGINDPRGATRKAQLFHDGVRGAHAPTVLDVPWVDDPEVPQGLAGASAYLMKPAGAWHALNLVDRLGAWPNDALLCKQLVPGLGVTRTYYTRVQGTRSRLA